MRPNILDSLRERVLLSDGGVGTELQRLGLEAGRCGEIWNIKHPEKVKAVHRSFLEAGAQLITTNSFRSNRFALGLYGHERRVRELNFTAAQLAREAVGEAAWVMGSIGPFGGFLEPLGETPAQEVYDAFLEQAAALIEGGVDAIVVETMSAAEELELAVRAAREAGAPVVLSTMTFAKAKDGYRTMMGVTPEQAVEAMERAGADVVGSNCGTDLTIEDQAEIVKRFRASSTKPIIVQPNAGRPELVGSDIVYRQTPEVMASRVEGLVRAGANIVGGCCGTTPEHIRLFRQRLKII